MAVLLRIDNPDFIAAIVFLPLSGAIIAITTSEALASLQQQLYAIGAALGFPLIIAVDALRRAAAARSAQQSLTNTIN